jgi:hypothetical protein
VEVYDEPPLEIAKVQDTPVYPIPLGNRGVPELMIARLESGDRAALSFQYTTHKNKVILDVLEGLIRFIQLISI